MQQASPPLVVDAAEPVDPTWCDWVTLVLFSLTAVAYAALGAAALDEPESGMVVALTVERGLGSSCTYTGRIMTCGQDVDLGGSYSDDGVFDENDLVCHQVAFRSPLSLMTGYECVDEEAWEGLEIGDAFIPE